MPTIPAARFQEQCLKLLDEVAGSGETLIVTKQGQPVAAVVPTRERGQPAAARERLAGSVIGWCEDIRIPDDVDAAAVAPESWHVVSDPQRILTGVPSSDRDLL